MRGVGPRGLPPRERRTQARVQSGPRVPLPTGHAAGGAPSDTPPCGAAPGIGMAASAARHATLGRREQLPGPAHAAAAAAGAAAAASAAGLHTRAAVGAGARAAGSGASAAQRSSVPRGAATRMDTVCCCHILCSPLLRCCWSDPRMRAGAGGVRTRSVRPLLRVTQCELCPQPPMGLISSQSEGLQTRDSMDLDLLEKVGGWGPRSRRVMRRMLALASGTAVRKLRCRGRIAVNAALALAPPARRCTSHADPVISPNSSRCS